MKHISIIGSGTMGNGIAHVFAQNDYTVSLIDVNPDALARALATIGKNFDRQIAKGNVSEEQKAKALSNITTFTSIEEGVKNAELAIEAATENEGLKMKIFKEMDQFAPSTCILASNTSSISITKLASATSRPESVIGMHFMNPVPVMKLVEVINGFSTSSEVTEIIIKVSESIGKITALSNDYPGFIANRILMPLINEAIHALHEGVGTVEDIDTIMKLGMAHPMGPLQLADFIGLDVCHSIMNVLYQGFGNPKYMPCPLLTNMVSAKQLGKKTGAGFYDYSGDGKELVVSKNFKKEALLV